MSSDHRDSSRQGDWRPGRRTADPRSLWPRRRRRREPLAPGGLTGGVTARRGAETCPQEREMVLRGALGSRCGVSTRSCILQWQTTLHTHCAIRPSWEIVTNALSAKLMHVTSVGTPLTCPFACRVGAGKGSSLTSLDAILGARE